MCLVGREPSVCQVEWELSVGQELSVGMELSVGLELSVDLEGCGA